MVNKDEIRRTMRERRKTVTPEARKAAGAQAVKDSPNAWLSFALDSATLIQNPPADGDVKVEKRDGSIVVLLPLALLWACWARRDW